MLGREYSLVGSMPARMVEELGSACNLSTPDIEAGGSNIQGHSWFHGEFEASLSYKPCLKKKKAKHP